MHEHHTTILEEKDWRHHWFVKNVLAEIPIIGGFFHTAKVPHALHHAGKSAAMLIGGTYGMMFGLLKKADTDTMATSVAKNTTNMALGMMAGTILYNGLVGIGRKIYAGCQGQASDPTGTALPQQVMSENLDVPSSSEGIQTYSPSI